MRWSFQTAFIRSAMVGVALACLGSSPSAAQAQTVPPQREFAATITTFWVTTKTLAAKDRKIYARYSVDRAGTTFLHQMSFICRKERGRFAYLNIFLRDMIAMGAVYKPVEREVSIDGRFTVDAQSAFTLPGHTLQTELFFDRTPATWDDLDKVLKATTIQLTLGEPATTVTYRTNPEFDQLMRETMSETGTLTGSFTTDAMLADCRKYRGEGAR
ncbi:MAG TPA: hypothetical protein VGN91_21775 [Bosea sp. (in: a-proteobacteria)]|nr:hypothetical protein [Bosea sp. (in: a-proteobacteria)]